MSTHRPADTAPLFEQLADRYDAWYDGPAGQVLVPMEVACLHRCWTGFQGRGWR